MPTFEIYHRGKKVESKEFNESFSVSADLLGRLFWIADHEKEDRGHIIVLWVQPKSKLPLFTPDGYRLAFVKPDWQLTLDGVQLSKKLYLNIDLNGKHINLQHGDYEFVCQFPEPV